MICPKCSSREVLLRKDVRFVDGPADEWSHPEHGVVIPFTCYACERDFVLELWQDANMVKQVIK